MLPSTDLPQWRELVEGKHDDKLTSFSLRMKINMLKHEISGGKTTVEKAVEELHDLCKKYEVIYAVDLEKVF